MRRYAVIYVTLLMAMVALFALAEVMDVPLLTAADPLEGRRGVLAALMGVSLLVVDIVLPVPSSAVMVAHGALFGVGVGSALSMLGSLAAFAVAFGVGRRSVDAVARIVSEEERQRVDRLLNRWGVVAIILSRPLPLVAETVAFAAGSSPLSWHSGLAAAALGSLPAAFLYAVAGALAASFAAGAVVFVAVVALALAAAVLLRHGDTARSGSKP